MKTFVAARGESGVALVTTVIVVAMLAVVAVALMQSTTVDRLSSRTSANYFKAQLAAQAGLALANATLAKQTANDSFIVVQNPNGQLFIGNGLRESKEFAYAPAFSARSSIEEPPIVRTEGVPSISVGDGGVFSSVLWGGLAVTSPVISWVYLVDSSGQTNARVAFWAEDLGGRLDLSVVGSTGKTARRETGTNAAEIALWSVFEPSINSDVNNGPVSDLMAARSALLTPASAMKASEAVTSSMLTDLATGLGYDTSEPDLVPFGLGYAAEGQPKLDLNDVNNRSASKVAAQINNNLPGFGLRGGGMAPDAYVNNIAANIIDFIDEDATPTIGPGFRGVEPLPYLNERATMYVSTKDPQQIDGSWVLEIVTTEYLEFWNMHDVATKDVSLTFSYENRQPVVFGLEQRLNTEGTTFEVNVPALPPNSFYVADGPSRTNFVSFASPLKPVGSPKLKGGSENLSYEISAGGVVYDRGLGCNISDVTLRTGRVYFSSTYPALGGRLPIGSQATDSFLSTHGDPRGSFFMPLPQHQVQYDENSSFGGRNKQHGNKGRPNSEVRIADWPDNGHNDEAGSAPPNDTTPPKKGTFSSDEQKPPAKVNPSVGRIENVTALGNVFDPMQWAEVASQRFPVEKPGPAFDGNWTNVTTTAQPSSFFSGGSTLRIGRPELSRFDNDGARASQLLDLFSAGSTVPLVTQGRININTAGTNALRALAAGVFHIADPVVAGSTGTGSGFVVPMTAVNAFVDSVISARSAKPFYSSSQLANLAVFGNRSTSGITAGNDAVTEEWFSRVFPLATVRSRNFLVHVVAETFFPGKTDRRISDFRACFQVYMKPERDTGGRITNSTPQVVRSWVDLQKKRL
jgi:hypothetical protein